MNREILFRGKPIDKNLSLCDREGANLFCKQISKTKRIGINTEGCNAPL